MEPIYILVSVVVSSLAGAGAGFCTGLVPGLHVNNLAAVVVASSAWVTGLFAVFCASSEDHAPALMVSCFLVSALVSHMFSEAVVSTYLGIPSGDTVSVLPAHRLARSGLGRSAVHVSAQGTLVGVVLGIALLPPVCLSLGPPLDAYSYLRPVMGLVVALLSAALVSSECIGRPTPLRRLLKAVSFFLLSGLVGLVVLDTCYFAAAMPDFPWMPRPFVNRSSLLLPMFAGLFGVPTILLSLRPEGVAREERRPRLEDGDGSLSVSMSLGDVAVSTLGGLLVGWIPGMTSGSSATLCSAGARRAVPEGGGEEEAARFIWLYSAIASCGAVLSVGAFFTIARARSGIMQAVDYFFGGFVDGTTDVYSLEPVFALVLSVLLSALVSHKAMLTLSGRTLERLQRVLCSRAAALSSLTFVVLLVLLLTGSRGALVLVASSSLGLLPPMLGMRRINLMGCLLLPITTTFLLG